MFTNRNEQVVNGPRKYRHFIHSPFTLEHENLTVKVDENGKMVVTQSHEDDTFDEIITSASLMNRIMRMYEIHTPFSLNHAGVQVKVAKNDKMILIQEQPDGSFDEINTTTALADRVIRMLYTTRKVVYKDVPYIGEAEEEVKDNG